MGGPATSKVFCFFIDLFIFVVLSPFEGESSLLGLLFVGLGCLKLAAAAMNMSSCYFRIYSTLCLIKDCNFKFLGSAVKRSVNSVHLDFNFAGVLGVPKMLY